MMPTATYARLNKWWHADLPVNWVEDFGRRVIEEAMIHASAQQWLRRAEEFEDARPRRGDFHGRATNEQLRERHDRLTRQARACRDHAEFIMMGGFDVRV